MLLVVSGDDHDDDFQLLSMSPNVAIDLEFAVYVSDIKFEGNDVDKEE